MEAMIKIILMFSLILVCLSTTSPAVLSAPLLDDVPSDHWAQNAVASLASRGLMEGYPDGYFKGDRALTRYEMAMVVARLLAQNDRAHAAIATKAELEDVTKLTTLLGDELESEGVRISDLEKHFRELKMRLDRK